MKTVMPAKILEYALTDWGRNSLKELHSELKEFDIKAYELLGL